MTVAPSPGLTSPAPEPRPVVKPEPAPAAAPRPKLSNGSSTLSVDRLADLWTQIRLDVKTIDRRIEALLAATDPYDIDGNMVLLTTPYEFHCQRLNNDNERGIIADVIGRIVGEPVQVSCYQRGQEPPKTNRAAAPAPAVTPVPASSSSEPDLDGPPTISGDELPDPLPPDDETSGAASRPAAKAKSGNIADERIKAAMSIFDAEPADDLPIP
jgi:DNA polymerase-3 subunit gamma/tau